MNDNTELPITRSIKETADAILPAVEGEAAPAEPAAAPVAAPRPGEPDWDAIRLEAGAHIAGELQQAHTQYHEHLAHEHEILGEAIPGWSDLPTRAQIQRELRTFAESQGYTAEDLRGVSDHRAVVMAWNALQAGKERATPPSVEPAASVRRERKADAELREAFTRFERTHRQRDAAKIFEGLF
jgi:hypothetical protein